MHSAAFLTVMFPVSGRECNILSPFSTKLSGTCHEDDTGCHDHRRRHLSFWGAAKQWLYWYTVMHAARAPLYPSPLVPSPKRGYTSAEEYTSAEKSMLAIR